MNSFKIERLTKEQYIVGDNKYYVEYRGCGLNNQLDYRIINMTNKSRGPVEIVVERPFSQNEMTLACVKRGQLTPEEAAVLETKGIRVPNEWVKYPRIPLGNRIRNFFFPDVTGHPA